MEKEVGLPVGANSNERVIPPTVSEYFSTQLHFIFFNLSNFEEDTRKSLLMRIPCYVRICVREREIVALINSSEFRG